jgi:hypothetical protein
MRVRERVRERERERRERELTSNIVKQRAHNDREHLELQVLLFAGLDSLLEDEEEEDKKMVKACCPLRFLRSMPVSLIVPMSTC